MKLILLFCLAISTIGCYADYNIPLRDYEYNHVYVAPRLVYQPYYHPHGRPYRYAPPHRSYSKPRRIGH